MKAAIVESPGRLVVKDIPEPKMDEYDSLCPMLYGTTCSGTDSELITGAFKETNDSYLLVLGHEKCRPDP